MRGTLYSLAMFCAALVTLTGLPPALFAGDNEPGTKGSATKEAGTKEAGAASDSPKQDDAGTAKKGASGYQAQLLDDPLSALEPQKPRTVAEQQRVEALAHFAAGKILEARSDFQGALNAYKKAIALDPHAVVVYRAMIPLAFSLNFTDDAVKWALRAVELDPSDFQLLRRLGVHQAGQGDFAGAIRLLEQAAKAPDLKKESALNVALMKDLALLYKSTNQINEAADKYEVVFQALLNPEKFHLDFKTRALLLQDPAATYEQMGQAFLDAKRPPLAIQAFQKAAESKKGNGGNLSFNLAQVYLQSNEAEKSLEELQKYFDAQRQSKGKAAYELLAQILQKLDKAGDLIPRLEALAEKDERNSILQYFLADQYLAQKRLDDAEKLYRKTLATSAELQGYLGLANVYRQQGRPAILIETLAKGFSESGEIDGLQVEIKSIAADEKLLAQVLDEGRKLAAEQPPKLDFAQAFVLANLAAEAKKTPEAQEFYRAAVPLAKGREALATLYDDWGRYLVDAKQFADAAKVFEEATNEAALAQNKPNFLYLLAQAFEFAGNTKGALEAIAEARQIIPDSPALQFQEAWIFYHSHQYDEAIKRFEKLVATAQPPQFKEIVRRAQFSISNIHVLQGNLRKGEEILEGILLEMPDDPSVNNDLGYLYADQGKDLEKAEKMIRKALTAEPDNGAYLDSMGWVLFKQGKFAEALPHLEKAVKKSTGGDETVWDHLGDAYLRLQQPAKALDSWKKALENAKAASRPDEKLIGRLQEKIKTSEAGGGKLKPERANSP